MVFDGMDIDVDMFALKAVPITKTGSATDITRIVLSDIDNNGVYPGTCGITR
ncbi:MAG: hypothetical protein GJ680_07450 [Alteromonadaceae bacterium]|nr:hypothetical protein [Alteromonadaceae bacterium]